MDTAQPSTVESKVQQVKDNTASKNATQQVHERQKIAQQRKQTVKTSTQQPQSYTKFKKHGTMGNWNPDMTDVSALLRTFAGQITAAVSKSIKATIFRPMGRAFDCFLVSTLREIFENSDMDAFVRKAIKLQSKNLKYITRKEIAAIYHSNHNYSKGNKAKHGTRNQISNMANSLPNSGSKSMKHQLEKTPRVEFEMNRDLHYMVKDIVARDAHAMIEHIFIGIFQNAFVRPSVSHFGSLIATELSGYITNAAYSVLINELCVPENQNMNKKQDDSSVKRNAGISCGTSTNSDSTKQEGIQRQGNAKRTKHSEPHSNHQSCNQVMSQDEIAGEMSNDAIFDTSKN